VKLREPSGAAYVAERDTPLCPWAKARLMIRAHRNVAVTAFANKPARVAWSALRRGQRFAAAGMPRAAERLGRSHSKRRATQGICERVTTRQFNSRTARGTGARVSPSWPGGKTSKAGYVDAYCSR
jgi:hypothetical protein